MKKVLVSVISALVLSACGSPSTSEAPGLIQPSPAPPELEPVVEFATPACISPEPTQGDIDRALTVTGGVFESDAWERSYTVSEDSVAVSWYSETLVSVAFLEALIFPCGYEDLDLDAFFNVDNWGIIFGGYQSYQMNAECRNDDNGLRLYEFSAIDQGAEYDIRYWVLSDTDARVLTFMLVTPVESPDLMDEYAYSLFPTIQSCN